MDVKTIFLNGYLEEEVYMDQPEGFSVDGKDQMLCKLKKSIYGLKQASRQWNIKFNDTITSFGFEENAVDRCIYRKVSESKFIFLVLYVDDILLAANVLGILRHMKDFLLNNFEMDEFLRNLMLMNVQLELFPFKRETNSVSRIAHRMFWKESK